MIEWVLIIAASLGVPWDEPVPIPESCQTNADCAEGSFCEVPPGECIESGFCTTDFQCPDGFVCELERATCIPAAPPPLPACEELTSEEECIIRVDCSPIYIGVGCTCNGVPCACTASDPGCACEKYEFAGCVSL